MARRLWISAQKVRCQSRFRPCLRLIALLAVLYSLPQNGRGAPSTQKNDLRGMEGTGSKSTTMGSTRSPIPTRYASVVTQRPSGNTGHPVEVKESWPTSPHYPRYLTTYNPNDDRGSGIESRKLQSDDDSRNLTTYNSDEDRWLRFESKKIPFAMNHTAAEVLYSTVTVFPHIMNNSGKNTVENSKPVEMLEIW